MYDRKINISETEKNRILNLHENRKIKEWKFLFEQTAQPQAAPKPPATKDEIIAFQEYAVKMKKNIGTKDPFRKGPGVDGIFGDKTKAAWNELGNEYNKTKEIQTSGNDALTYTYYIKDASGNETTKKFTTIQELNNAIAAKQVTPETRVWKKDMGQIPKLVKDINSTAINDAIASIAPEAKASEKPGSTFKVSPDGKEPAKDYTAEQLTTAMKNGTLTQNAFVVVTDDATGKSEYKPIMQNVEASKIINLALGPESLKSEIKSTGNEALDAWLKTDTGKVYLSKTDTKYKEAFIDFLEQTNDPIIAQVGGKDAMRKILLGDFSADTKLARAGQQVTGAFKRAGQAFAGKDTKINRGYTA